MMDVTATLECLGVLGTLGFPTATTPTTTSTASLATILTATSSPIGGAYGGDRGVFQVFGVCQGSRVVGLYGCYSWGFRLVSHPNFVCEFKDSLVSILVEWFVTYKCFDVCWEIFNPIAIYYFGTASRL